MRAEVSSNCHQIIEDLGRLTVLPSVITHWFQICCLGSQPLIKGISKLISHIPFASRGNNFLVMHPVRGVFVKPVMSRRPKPDRFTATKEQQVLFHLQSHWLSESGPLKCFLTPISSCREVDWDSQARIWVLFPFGPRWTANWVGGGW